MVPEFILNNVAPAGIELGKNLLTAYTERGIDAGTGKLWLELKKKKSEMRDAEAELYDTIECIVKKHCKQAEIETMRPLPNDSSVAYISEMILKSWSDNGYIDDVTYQMIERYPLGLNIHCDIGYNVELIRDFCYEMRGKQLSFEEVKMLFPEHCIEEQVKIFKDLL